MEYGLDANNNGVLDAGEINATLTKYVCNGINSTSSSTQGLRIGFSSSTTWTCPAGVTQITVEVWGGGGGGGGSSMAGNGYYVGYYGNSYQYSFGCYNGSNAFIRGAGGNGGKGGYSQQIISVTPGQSYVVTIGLGGSGGNAGSFTVIGWGNSATTSTIQATDGASGGTTNFGGLVTANGGVGGAAGLASNGGYSYISATCTNGALGSNGNVINFGNSVQILNSEQPRSYIPVGYIYQSVVVGCSIGGVGATGSEGSNNSSSVSQNSFSNGQQGSQGENGYCVISY
jgi:hypothetical protein